MMFFCLTAWMMATALAPFQPFQPFQEVREYVSPSGRKFYGALDVRVLEPV